MCGYTCPYSQKLNQFGFIVCSALNKERKDMRIKDNALKCLCAHQRHCPISRQAENTDGAKSCYEMMRQRTV